MEEKEIKDIICYNRKRLGLTQEQLAEKLNVSNKTVSKWETGKSYPDVLLVPAITKELGISINQFFDCEDTKPEVISKSNKEKLTKIRSNLILAFCLLIVTPIFIGLIPVLPLMELIIFLAISGIVALISSVILFVLETSKIDDIAISKNDKKTIASIKNIWGFYCLVWQLIISVLTFLLYPIFNEHSFLAWIVIFISLLIFVVMVRILLRCKILFISVKNLILVIVSAMIFIFGTVMMLIVNASIWSGILVISQIVNQIILLTSNEIGD